MLKTQPLTFTKKYETARIRLTSPILRIGGQFSQLNPYEYIQDGDRVYLPNEEALGRVLLERGKLKEYIEKIEDRKDINSILKNLDEDWQFVEDNEGNPIFPKIGITRKWTSKRITDLKPMIRNGFSQPYIPGTSIKGAMRTAIAYHLLKNANKYNTPTKVSEIEEKLRELLGNGKLKRKPQTADDGLFMNSLFDHFSLNYEGKEYSSARNTSNHQNNPNTDILRAIEISDSPPVLEKSLTNKKTGKKKLFNIPVTTEVYVSSHFEDYKAKHRVSIFAEMLFNVSTEFTITLDTEMLKWFHHQDNMKIPFNSINDLIKICQEFAQEQWDGEHDYWNFIRNNNHRDKKLDFDLIREFYKNEKCPYQLRLGWGTGMGGTTINWLLEDKLRAKIRDTCGIKAPNFPAPKSRRTILNRKEDIAYVPGWVKLKVL